MPTGKVVDFGVESKLCLKCCAKSHLDLNSQEYIEWMEAHGPKCTANFKKSSKTVEAQGVVHIWGRSVQKHNLRYVDFVGDGDCSSHRDVLMGCVVHIQKRIRGKLRSKKKDLKGKKLSDGKTISGKIGLSAA